MLGMVSAVIGVLVLFATQRAFPELNELFKSFSSIGYLLLAGAFAVSTFNGIFYYAQPGFKYHVRNITGQEQMVSDTGYNTYLFGRVYAWKNAMSVQATRGGEGRHRRNRGLFLHVGQSALPILGLFGSGGCRCDRNRAV